MRVFIKTLLVFALFFWTAAQIGHAQDKEEKSSFVAFVEKQLSAPNRQISLNGLEGTLSSNVKLESITIADERGIWLKITKPELVWSRAALLSGKLDIESLTADRIDWLRNADVDESLPAPEASSFALPELPVAVVIKKLSVPLIAFDKSVFGLQSKAGVDGKITLEDGALDLDLVIDRKDGPGGSFKAVAQYANVSKVLKLDVKLDEPEDGILANLLNLEGKPPVSLSIKGDAPVSDLDVALAFDVSSRRILSGALKLSKEDAGTRIKTDLNGPLSSILPERMRDFFGIESRINADAVLASNGAIAINTLDLKSGALNLTASARQLADGFLSSLQFNLSLTQQGRDKIYLPTPDAETTLASGILKLNYDAENSQRWDADLSVKQFERDDFKIDEIALKSDGTIKGFENPSTRNLTFELDGQLDGFASKDPALNEAVGKAISLIGGGQWSSGKPLSLSRFQVLGETVKLVSTGEFADQTFDGSIELIANRLAAFSGLAAKKLRGRANLRADGKILPLSGGFDLEVNGTTRDLEIGEPAIDPLLADETTLLGRLKRDENGIEFRGLKLANKKFETKLDGKFSSEQSDIIATALLRNLATVSEQASGPLALKASLKGQQKPFDLNLELSVDEGRVAQRKISDLALSFSGLSDLESVKGKLSSTGQLDGKPVQVGGYLSADQKTIDLQQLLINVGQSKISGNLKRAANGLLDGNLTMNSDDISDLAALALVDASGAVNGAINLHADAGKQAGDADVRIKSFLYEDYRIQAASIDAKFQDLFGTPIVDGKISGRRIQASGLEVRSLSGTVKTTGSKTDFDAKVRLVQNAAEIDAKGSVERTGGSTVFSLKRLNLDSNITRARLTDPTRITIRDGSVQLSNASLAIGGGSLVLNGDAGNRLNFIADIRAVPLSIIDSFHPQTRARGTISGRARVGGTASSPDVTFDTTVAGLSVAPIADAGISPLSLQAEGRFTNNTITLNRASARNEQNIQLSASGRIPLSGGGLSLNADGTLPLSIAQNQLASRGASVSGTARVTVRVLGSLSNPDASGLIAVQDATLIDPLSNVKLTGIGILAGIKGQTITLNRAQANLASGGSVSANGTVGLAGGMPVNLNLILNNARYTDGQTFDTRASGQLALTGQLSRNPLLKGTIDLGRTEITVPETFTSGGELLKVKHVRPSAKIRRTLSRLKRALPVARPTSRPSIVQLDVSIDAPNQIFIRGRGLDAELGGRIRVQGSATDVRPIGAFTLRRGRFSILGQRLDLDSGTITLAGDLDPILNLVARTDAGDVEAFITLSGRASDLDVKFSSSPELPEDEVLALIIFGRGLGDLSPAQIVRLASIATELTGGNSPGLVDGIRKGTGLDDLDVVQDSDGNAAVKAGKYINDRVYLGVQAGKKSEATINLDITDNVKVRGAIGTDGDSSIGIFLEKDY